MRWAKRNPTELDVLRVTSQSTKWRLKKDIPLGIRERKGEFGPKMWGKCKERTFVLQENNLHEKSIRPCIFTANSSPRIHGSCLPRMRLFLSLSISFTFLIRKNTNSQAEIQLLKRHSQDKTNYSRKDKKGFLHRQEFARVQRKYFLFFSGTFSWTLMMPTGTHTL